MKRMLGFFIQDKLYLPSKLNGRLQHIDINDGLPECGMLPLNSICAGGFGNLVMPENNPK